EHLEGAVAVHVPGEAQARRELVVDLDVGLAVAVLVLEGIPADAAVQHEVVGDAPGILEVVRALVDLDRRTLADVVAQGVGRGRIGDAGTVVDVVVTVRVGAADHGVEVVDVEAAADEVVAQLPRGVDAVLVALVLPVGAGDRASEVAVADDGAQRIRVADRQRTAVADRTAAADLGVEITVVADLLAIGLDRVVGAREFAVAGEHAQGEAVGQVAGVLQRVALAAGLAEA